MTENIELVLSEKEALEILTEGLQRKLLYGENLSSRYGGVATDVRLETTKHTGEITMIVSWNNNPPVAASPETPIAAEAEPDSVPENL